MLSGHIFQAPYSTLIFSPVSYTHLDVYKRQEVSTAAKRAAANDQTKAERVGTRRPLRITLFLTNQGDTDKERRVLDWKLSSLRLLVVETSDHQTGAA